MGVDLEGKVLDRVAVPDGICRVLFRKLKGIGEVLAVVLQDTLTDLGDVQQTVHQIGSPVAVGLAVGDVVAEHAETLEWLAGLVRKIANHSLGTRVRTAPVASPACSTSVS